MNKTGLIQQIHKGLRVWLFNAGAHIQQTDFSNTSEGRESVKELLQILKSLEKKLFTEDQYFLPLLALHSPFLVSSLQTEKLGLKELTVRLNKCLENYLLPGTDAYYLKTGGCIQDLFMELLSSLLLYMKRQESLINGFGAQINQSGLNNLMTLAEEHAMEFSFLIIKGMSNREISEWLESGTEGMLDWKRKILGSLSPDRLATVGKDFQRRAKSGLVAA